jgi:Eco57I restriction-modification methylase
METAPLKSFAVKARVELMTTVGARIAVVLAENSFARVESADAVRILEAAIARDGIEQVIDRVAYTWFNRIIALRFMDANGYTASGVVSPEAGRTTGQPEILAEAKAGTFDGAVVSDATQATITALLNGTRPSPDPQGEAYGLLLEVYCRFWHNSMPFMFERAGDYTELLIPPALLADDSIRDLAVRTLTGEVCSEVEVIGWLYQFYISERKEEVFAGFKRNQKAGAAEIPAATQLFTPHWIVRYLVENSIGRLWLLNNPASDLAEHMEYYIQTVDQTDFLKISTPEELKVIDPAVGSGHMLTYAFDLLYAIYRERGYDPAEIPGLILEHNLYGTEIDPRAGTLAAFALTMKAAAKRKLFLKKPVQPNICVLENIHFATDELDYLWSLTSSTGIARADADEFWNAFVHADTLGSLAQPAVNVAFQLGPAVHQAAANGDLLHANTISKARGVILQAHYLAPKYSVVVANPPYMGSGNMGTRLTEFLKVHYPNEKQDLYACFVTRAYDLALDQALVAMVVGDTWMTLSTAEAFRARLIDEGGLISCVHLHDVSNHPDIFGANTAFVLGRGNKVDFRCTFIYLDELSMERKQRDLISAIRADGGPHVYKVSSSTFREVPGKAFAYRMGESVRKIFGTFPELAQFGDARQGLSPGDTSRFVRLWFEVSRSKTGIGIASSQLAELSGMKWFPFNKGGAFRRWYGNVDHVLNWFDGGRELLDFRPRSVIRNPKYFFQPAVTWSSVSSGESAFRLVDAGVIFSDVGQSIFASSENRSLLLAVLNSQFGSNILALLAPNLHFQAGVIATVPISQDLEPGYVDLVDELVETSRFDWNAQETSPGFGALEWAESGTATGLVSVLEESFSNRQEITDRVLELESRLDSIVARGYLLPDDEHETRRRSRIALALNPYFGADDLSTEEVRAQFRRKSLIDLVSYAVGCMFGRYSLDEPGLILADQESTLQDYMAKVPNPTFLPDADNVIPIVDGDWFEDDIVAGFRKFLRVSFGDEHFDENLRFVTESLGVKDLRDYFVKSFYDDHVKRYKKRPIYWLFRSPKNSFSALVYLHRYTSSTVSTVLTGYLREFIGKLEANLDYQERVAAGMGDAAARDRAASAKEADRIRKVLVELRDYEHDILFPLAGQNIELDLDDGVLVNYQKLGSALKDIGLKKSGSDE